MNLRRVVRAAFRQSAVELVLDGLDGRDDIPLHGLEMLSELDIDADSWRQKISLKRAVRKSSRHDEH